MSTRDDIERALEAATPDPRALVWSWVRRSAVTCGQSYEHAIVAADLVGIEFDESPTMTALLSSPEWLRWQQERIRELEAALGAIACAPYQECKHLECRDAHAALAALEDRR